MIITDPDYKMETIKDVEDFEEINKLELNKILEISQFYKNRLRVKSHSISYNPVTNTWYASILFENVRLQKN